ncbi:hypothetical protein C7212DRAFT_338598 [Tuber magnatum]|uniref:Uncharacterized protein n=1 Tax=Tuber magnatum TaxID=42249 RepID=A0A317SD09_9PEZI|nr:hypothetical protein C7212DRAFT_338598 [Tuber magnatum]
MPRNHAEYPEPNLGLQPDIHDFACYVNAAMVRIDGVPNMPPIAHGAGILQLFWSILLKESGCQMARR